MTFLANQGFDARNKTDNLSIKIVNFSFRKKSSVDILMEEIGSLVFERLEFQYGEKSRHIQPIRFRMQETKPTTFLQMGSYGLR